MKLSSLGLLGLLAVMIIMSFSASAGAQFNPLGAASTIQNVWNSPTPTSLSPSSRIGGGSVIRDKFGFFWETRMDPPAPVIANGFSTQATVDSASIIHRVLLDRAGKMYFGYDVQVDALPNTDQFRVTFKPLVITAAMAQTLALDAWSDWVSLAIPRFPAPQIVHSREILELPLLTNSATRQKIVDYVSIQEPAAKVSGFERPIETEFTFATGPVRDITANDVEMRIRAPRISINGKVEVSTNQTSGGTGTFVWFYMPNHGRIILSLGPNPKLGFRRLGEVRGSSLMFSIGADKFTLSSATRIAPGQEAFSLYVLHQPNWKPTYLFADTSAFNIGAVDQFDALDK